MRKVLGYFVAILVAIFPIFLRAEETATKVNLSDYNTMNFVETLADEEIELKYKDYKETDDQITIYLFRGKGCGFCRAFLNFLNENAEEYGKYFKVVSFESWYDEKNPELLDTIGNFLEQPAGGVPYIIIGDKVFGGYAESYDDGIKSAITDLYNSKDRYDVFEAYNDSIKYHMSDLTKSVLWNLAIVAVATVVIVLCVRSAKNEILAEINKRNRYVNTVKNVEKTSEETHNNHRKPAKKSNAKKRN